MGEFDHGLEKQEGPVLKMGLSWLHVVICADGIEGSNVAGLDWTG